NASLKVVTIAFLWFYFAGFMLWAFIFAYQRYLIPIELLTGITIWVLVSQIVTDRRTITVAMTVFLIVSLATIKVPDWSHWTGAPHRGNYFGLNVSAEVASTPADYLVYGKWMTYILPFLNPDSRFFGITFLDSDKYGKTDPRFDTSIKIALEANRNRPIRLL